MSSIEQGSPLERAKPSEAITEFDRKVYDSMAKPYAHMMFLQAYNEYMVQHLALNQPPISISQVFGFSQFTAQANTVATDQTTSSATYTDLATVGPQISGLADGQYLVLFGSGIYNTSASTQSYMSFSVNGGTESTDHIQADSGAGNTVIPGGRAALVTMESGGNNTIKARYKRGSAGTAGFTGRWLVVIRYASV